MFDIFEHPWGLLTVAVVVFIIMRIIRAITPAPKRWFTVAVYALPAAVAVTAFALDYFVRTDSEQINSVISNLVRAVEKENPNAIEPLISEGYSDSSHGTKENLMRHCRLRLSEPLVDQAIRTIVSIDITPPTATAVFTVRLVFNEQSDIAQNYMKIILVKVKMNLRKEPDSKWRITHIELLELNMQPINWQQIRDFD